MKDKKIDIHDLFKDYEDFEDQIDLQSAKKELEKIKSGESEVFTWEEVFDEDKTKEKTAV